MVEVRMAMISSQSSMRFAMRDGGSQWESPFVATAGLTGAPAGVEDELKLLFAGTTPVTLFPVGTNRVGTGDLLPDHQISYPWKTGCLHPLASAVLVCVHGLPTSSLRPSITPCNSVG